MKRERAKMAVNLKGQTLKEFPAMAEKLEAIPAGVDWVDNARANGGEPPRVPVIQIDAAGRYWWRGLRSVFFVQGGERITLDGRQVTAHRRIMETDMRGECWLWVVSDSGQATAGKFRAPLPLTSREDALVYYARGIHGDATPAQLAARLGWSGGEAAGVAGRFIEIIHAHAGGWAPEVIARKLAELPEVIIPSGEAGEVARAVSWRELLETVEALRGEVAGLRAEVERLRGMVI